MAEMTNSYVLGQILCAIYHVASRRTTRSFAAKVIGSIVKNLQTQYDFLKYVTINDKGVLDEKEAVAISPDINTIDKQRIGKSIEAIVRIVYMDIIGKAGLFFISEIKRQAGEDIISALVEYNVDLASLQVEQHHIYRSREAKRRRKKDDVSLLGYTWKNVSSWKYDPNKKTCILYDDNGKILDNLHLENIIENYVKNLSEGTEEIPEDLKEKIDVTDKEYELLKMLNTRDMDSESAINLLHIDKENFEQMVKKLLDFELLQYSSFNVVELTELGISYIQKREESQEMGENVKI